MDKGEPSRKSNDSEGDGERPFKKARYVWQLKGKYHLKDNNQKQATSMDDAEDTTLEEPESQSDSDSEVEPALINNNSIKIPTAFYEKCCIDNLLIQSNALLDTVQEDSDQECANNIDKSILDEIPITLVKPSLRNQDDYMYEWQARQVAKSFVDNTINSILEHWRIAAFDVEDFVEDCENGEQVEDEGILMAIQSHGLQSGPRFEPPEVVQAPREMPVHPSADPMHFLNTAISAAIQKKGLSSN
ncbi:PREDICTED: uncharacterized protein LOC108563312 [Nicrophorus vespilloides]|uniref:Uncharacterized protein LOC108563312 n=1 Tax=Nicrophorus vespilloides TaxID=110193 RepID=A0ABM1MS84_NICVS|nr:PREDICTED: uncharacterized protein LOC108563312 [Nicrophorus vespilloides]XP_017777435.1 PREDICTED: uncharacterized protein LOC108563312 [Nicrophorus vespilloides]